MSVTILSAQTQIAAKEHRCDYCNQIIYKGEKYGLQNNVCDRVLYTWKYHLSCEELASKLGLFNEAGDEGVTDDLFQECVCDKYADISDIDEDEDIDDVSFSEKLRAVKEYFLNK